MFSFPLISQQPFTSDYPRGDIYEMISPDLLHQLIKGVFKDHLVTWVLNYLDITHTEARSKAIMDDIDMRYVIHLCTFVVANSIPGQNCSGTSFSRFAPVSSRAPFQTVDRG